MEIKKTKLNIIQAGQIAVDELIKVAKEPIVDSGDDISADRLKNAAATNKLAIFAAFEILTRIQEEKDILNEKPKETKEKKKSISIHMHANDKHRENPKKRGAVSDSLPRGDRAERGSTGSPPCKGGAAKKRSLFSTFPMFVSSLSW